MEEEEFVILEKYHDEIKELEKNTEDLCEIFKGLHKLAELQGEKINDIVELINATKNNVDLGRN